MLLSAYGQRKTQNFIIVKVLIKQQTRAKFNYIRNFQLTQSCVMRSYWFHKGNIITFITNWL